MHKAVVQEGPKVHIVSLGATIQVIILEDIVLGIRVCTEVLITLSLNHDIVAEEVPEVQANLEEFILWDI